VCFGLLAPIERNATFPLAKSPARNPSREKSGKRKCDVRARIRASFAHPLALAVETKRHPRYILGGFRLKTDFGRRRTEQVRSKAIGVP